MTTTVTLADLGVVVDPGAGWHPRADKAEAWDTNGNLVDLTDDQVYAHYRKLEAADQPDQTFEPLAAEDSTTTPVGQV